MSSSFVIAYMRELDADIERHRHAIREHQIAIQQLEDTRVLMQQREEFKAYANGQASPFGTLPGGAAIVTRDPRVTAQNAPALALAAQPQAISGPAPDLPEREQQRAPKKRDYAEEYRRRYIKKHGVEPPPAEERKRLQKQRWQRDYRDRLKTEGRPRPDRDPGKRSLYDQIERIMRAEPKRVFDLNTIHDRVELGDRHIGGISQALTTLIRKGVIQRLDVGTYQLVQR
jgi:hypothetical protein